VNSIKKRKSDTIDVIRKPAVWRKTVQGCVSGSRSRGRQSRRTVDWTGKTSTRQAYKRVELVEFNVPFDTYNRSFRKRQTDGIMFCSPPTLWEDGTIVDDDESMKSKDSNLIIRIIIN